MLLHIIKFLLNIIPICAETIKLIDSINWVDLFVFSIYGFVSIFFGGDSCFLFKGIRKVNYYTYMAIAVGSKVVSENV